MILQLLLVISLSSAYAQFRPNVEMTEIPCRIGGPLVPTQDGQRIKFMQCGSNGKYMILPCVQGTYFDRQTSTCAIESGSSSNFVKRPTQFDSFGIGKNAWQSSQVRPQPNQNFQGRPEVTGNRQNVWPSTKPEQVPNLPWVQNGQQIKQPNQAVQPSNRIEGNSPLYLQAGIIHGSPNLQNSRGQLSSNGANGQNNGQPRNPFKTNGFPRQPDLPQQNQFQGQLGSQANQFGSNQSPFWNPNGQQPQGPSQGLGPPPRQPLTNAPRPQFTSRPTFQQQFQTQPPRPWTPPPFTPRPTYPTQQPTRPSRPNQVRPNQVRPNQVRPNQVRPSIPQINFPLTAQNLGPQPQQPRTPHHQFQTVTEAPNFGPQSQQNQQNQRPFFNLPPAQLLEQQAGAAPFVYVIAGPPDPSTGELTFYPFQPPKGFQPGQPIRVKTFEGQPPPGRLPPRQPQHPRPRPRPQPRVEHEPDPPSFVYLDEDCKSGSSCPFRNDGALFCPDLRNGTVYFICAPTGWVKQLCPAGLHFAGDHCDSTAIAADFIRKSRDELDESDSWDQPGIPSSFESDSSFKGPLPSGVDIEELPDYVRSEVDNYNRMGPSQHDQEGNGIDHNKSNDKFKAHAFTQLPDAPSNTEQSPSQGLELVTLPSTHDPVPLWTPTIGSVCSLHSDPKNQVWPDPSNHRTFFMCVPHNDGQKGDRNGHWVRMQCPVGTVFDPYLRQCDSRLVEYEAHKLRLHPYFDSPKDSEEHASTS